MSTMKKKKLTKMLPSNSHKKPDQLETDITESSQFLLCSVYGKALFH